MIDPFGVRADPARGNPELILTFSGPSDILAASEVRRSLVGLLDFKSSVGG